jgi:NADPH:quinone reductase-like Zn-dependent oxidoreductase
MSSYNRYIMQAFIYTKYGSPDVLELLEIDKPVPADDQVLVKVHAVSINAYDWHMLTADIFLVRLMGEGLRKPKKQILGADIAGRVEAVGKNVTQFQPGDAVYGDIAGCGSGGFAEYAVAPEKSLALKPTNLSFEQAAAVPMAAITALQGLRDVGKIQPRQKVLIQGASGGVGTFAVQLAKTFGAEVTAVCSTAKMDIARSLGADRVIDYTRADFTRGKEKYDLILAANGYHSLPAYRRVLAPGGIYAMAGGAPGQLFQAVLLGRLMSKKDGKTLAVVTARQSQDDLVTLCELIEAGRVAPLIDRRYPFPEAAEAMRYLGAGHARGKIVIVIKGE